MQTGQNSIAPENSLPQLGQVRLSSVFMRLIVLRPRSGLRKENGFPRRFLPDPTPCGRPPLAKVRCTAFASEPVSATVLDLLLLVECENDSVYKCPDHSVSFVM